MPSDFDVYDDIDADRNYFSELYPSLEGVNNSQYYDSISFKSLQTPISSKDLSVIHLNINSIGANGDKFLSFLASLDYKFDVICLTETYLKQGEKADYYFPNYKIFYSGRSNRSCGGVMICIADQFDCELISPLTLNLPHIESVTVKISFQNKKTLVSTIYRPPNSNFDLFHTFIENNFPVREHLTSDNIICGDFNLNLLNAH